MRRLATVLATVAMSAPVVPAFADSSTVPGSKYRGYYFMVAPAEDARRCIVWRESRNTLDAVSPGDHKGLYQMTDELADGAVWHMRFDPIDPITKAQRVRLQSMPVTKWPRYWQDRAFYSIWNYTGPGSGRDHWFLAGSPCNGLAR